MKNNLLLEFEHKINFENKMSHIKAYLKFKVPYGNCIKKVTHLLKNPYWVSKILPSGI